MSKVKTKITAAVPLLVFLGRMAMGEKPSTSDWPEGKTYAVSLTYNDRIQSQIDYALPQLNAAKLRGTFFFAGGFEQR